MDDNLRILSNQYLASEGLWLSVSRRVLNISGEDLLHQFMAAAIQKSCFEVYFSPGRGSSSPNFLVYFSYAWKASRMAPLSAEKRVNKKTPKR